MSLEWQEKKMSLQLDMCNTISMKQDPIALLNVIAYTYQHLNNSKVD